MKVYKEAKFQDDSYYFVVEPSDVLAPIAKRNALYYKEKVGAFKKYDIEKFNFLHHIHRPSFRTFYKVEDLSGTIYTHSCEGKNDMTYTTLLMRVRANLGNTRRCVVNMADTLYDYLDETIDTSCLMSIVYNPGKVTLTFRASDMENELHTDLLLIKQFFIDPIYKKHNALSGSSISTESPEIHVIAVTAQNVETDLKSFIIC